MAIDRNRGKAAGILGGIVVFEGFFVVWQAWGDVAGYLRWLGFLPGRHWPQPVGYATAAVVAIGFVALSARLPSVRENLIRPSWLKVLAIGVAVAAGILEEIAFRPLLMNALQERGMGPVVQVVLSGLGFGVIHGVWAFFGKKWHAGAGAIVATGLLGSALAVVYLVSGRSVAPCIAAHFALNVFAEPGLVLAALRGEMGRRRTAVVRG